MRARQDLTRWNRSGLDRFTYVDGNAIEYLEMLRQRLVEQFPNSKNGSPSWLNPAELIPADEQPEINESLVQRQRRLSLRARRLQETYHQDRRDWAWEISRSFARSCHILTSYADAYANEGHLGTATQWDHVRRLVEMLDYHPAPPASAHTRLAIICKGDKPGLLHKGFQVKNSPQDGADKVIFETLEDVNLDPALNKLQALGWNLSPVALGDGGGTGREQQFSYVSNRAALDLQSLGHHHALKLDTLQPTDGFRIRHFAELDADNATVAIDTSLLWRWKARADFLINFAPPGEWSAIDDWLLPAVDNSDAQDLADIGGNTLETAIQLKLEIERVQICLDGNVFSNTLFRQLFAPYAADRTWIETRWVAPGKPKVKAGEVAMVFNDRDNIGEAVRINRVETVEPEDADASSTAATTRDKILQIDLQPSLVQNHWSDWRKGDTALRYAPGWSEKCWLNGDNVIRTKEPHGLTAGTFIGWDRNRRHRGWWNFRSVEYAEIIEADKRNIRIRYTGVLPVEFTEIIELRPIEEAVVSPDYEDIVLLGQAGEADTRDVLVDVPPGFTEPLDLSDIFTVNDIPATTSGAGGGLLPPASLPKIGSFLFPSPLLPMDLVKAAVELLLNLGVMQIPSTEEPVFKGLPFEGLLEGMGSLDDAAGKLFGMLDEMQFKRDPDGDLEDLIEWKDTDPLTSIDKLTKLLAASSGADTTIFQKIKSDVQSSGPLLVVPADPPVKAIVDSADPLYVFEASAEKLRSGDWVVADFLHGLQALQVDVVEILSRGRDGDSFALSFSRLAPNPGELRQVHADFRGELVPENHQLNRTEIVGDEIELEQLPPGLKVCDLVMLTAPGQESILAKIINIEGNKITTDPPAKGFNFGELVIRANIVAAGHGETKPGKILGSGDATKSNQAFVLAVDNPSFVADPSMSSGVAAAIDVMVEGRIWEQVSSLRDSGTDDHHYTVRVTEAGRIKIIFGDGQYGRRLPTGKNNLRVVYRTGSGTRGNLPARSLEKPVNPDPLVGAIFQHQPSVGGGNLEDLSSLRENAPATLLALERAVSLSDFTHLASARSSVWQARAYHETLQAGRMQVVNVVILPAGGVSDAQLETDLQLYLQQHAVPGVRVKVRNFVEQRFKLALTLYIDSAAFVAVEAAASAALAERFALQNRGLGEPLYISEIYQVVEAVAGVENSIVVLNDDPELRVIKALDGNSVIYLDTSAETDPPWLFIVSEEYRP